MKCAVIDACFPIEYPQRGAGLGAHYLRWEMDRHNISEVSPQEADVILVTCVSTESTPAIARIRKKYPRKPIIVGGAASTSPYSIGKYATAVCVGDGQEFCKTLFSKGLDDALYLPNIWIDGETRRVEVDQSFPWGIPPIQAEDGAYRLAVGRGCKNKCLFCQTSWAYNFQETPYPDIVAARAKRLQEHGKKFAYLSNDITQHEFFKKLPNVDSGSCSVRYMKQYGLPPARSVRLGIEGVSERLRKMVAKPISHDDLVKSASWLNANGRGVRWFMIAGLPTETAEDWAELKAAVQDWKRITPKGVLQISFTAWCPDPATPLSIMRTDNAYWDYFKDFSDWFFSGCGWSSRVKILKPQMPDARNRKAELSLGCVGAPSPNLRLIYPYESARQAAIKRLLTNYGEAAEIRGGDSNAGE